MGLEKTVSSGQVQSFHRKIQCTIFGSLYSITDCDVSIESDSFCILTLIRREISSKMKRLLGLGKEFGF